VNVDIMLNESEAAAAEEKLRALESMLGGLAPVVVAFSGGVDSCFLLATAARVIGHRATAVIGVSPSLAGSELREARDLASRFDVELREVETHELSVPEYVRNEPDRCYFCKQELFRRISDATRDIEGRVIIEGTNASDESDDRPGMRACAEMAVKSPLLDARLTKREIRWLSRKMDLPTWEKPEAACLASRIPTGSFVSRELLERLDEAEANLRDVGLREFRVRHMGTVARIETAQAEMQLALDRRDEIVARLRRLGYDYVTLDLAGYKKGGRAQTHGKGADPDGG